MNRSADELIDAMAFAALDKGGNVTFLAGDNELARLVTEWRRMKQGVEPSATGVARDRCAIDAMRLALKHLGPLLMVPEDGNMILPERSKAVQYIRMTLNLYQDVLDEKGKRMVAMLYPE